MKKIFLALSFLFFFSPAFSQTVTERNPEISANDLKKHIYYLASEELKGRGTGSEEILLAAEYIKNEFESLGLEPLFDSVYFQPFDILTKYELTGGNSFLVKLPDEEITFELNKAYTPLSFSAESLSVKGEIVFAGFGISDSEILKYDDYEGIDIKGKIALILSGSPEYDNPKFDNHISLRQKAIVAKNKGAAGLIIVNLYRPLSTEDRLRRLAYDGAPGFSGFPVVQLHRDYAEKFFNNFNLSIKEIQKEIEINQRPASFSLDGITAYLEVGMRKVYTRAVNAAALLKSGDDDYKNEYIVVGAHYDHLGMGEFGSLNRNAQSAIHYGADDNASGTAGVIELAEYFVSIKDKIKRNIIFIAFSAEEMGLLGSDHFVKNSPVPVENMIFMANLDMIGRMSDSLSLIIYGTGTASFFDSLLTVLNLTKNFKLSLHKGGIGSSDHASFYKNNVPVLFFFTGTHADYHRPTDTPDKIEYERQEEILKYVADVILALDRRSLRPEFISVASDETRRAVAKVYTGVVPDFASDSGGFKISGVSEGSPSQKAGLKAGDIIIKFGDKKIDNIYDYMSALNSHSAGETVELTVIRNNEQMSFSITLAAK